MAVITNRDNHAVGSAGEDESPAVEPVDPQVDAFCALPVANNAQDVVNYTQSLPGDPVYDFPIRRTGTGWVKAIVGLLTLVGVALAALLVVGPERAGNWIARFQTAADLHALPPVATPAPVRTLAPAVVVIATPAPEPVADAGSTPAVMALVPDAAPAVAEVVVDAAAPAVALPAPSARACVAWDVLAAHEPSEALMSAGMLGEHSDFCAERTALAEACPGCVLRPGD
jgi:hypothetical protein